MLTGSPQLGCALLPMTIGGGGSYTSPPGYPPDALLSLTPMIISPISSRATLLLVHTAPRHGSAGVAAVSTNIPLTMALMPGVKLASEIVIFTCPAMFQGRYSPWLKPDS